MPTGDFPPPEGKVWTDAFGWIDGGPRSYGWADLAEVCTECGAPLGNHFIGGPKYHPVERPSLWFWE